MRTWDRDTYIRRLTPFIREGVTLTRPEAYEVLALLTTEERKALMRVQALARIAKAQRRRREMAEARALTAA